MYFESIHLSHSLSLSLHTQSNVVSDARQQRGTPTTPGSAGPSVVVSPPTGWPQPPPPSNAYYTSAQPAEMDSLRREKEDLTSKLNYRNQEVEKLNAEISSLKGQVRKFL